MSNSGNGSANNGRRSRSANTTTTTTTTSISRKTDVQSSVPTKSNQLPEKSNISSLYNDNIKVTCATTATHRRDNSCTSRHQLQQKLTRDQHKDQQVLQYVEPQTHFKKKSPCKQGGGDTLSLTTAEEQIKDGSDEDDRLLVYCNENLISGRLDALIEHMVPTADYYPEHNYVFSFLLSARLFIRPHELLAQITKTWERQQQSSNTDVVDEANFSHLRVTASASPLAQRKAGNDVGVSSSPPPDGHKIQRTSTQKSAQHCIRLLSEWIEIFPYDFRDERLMQQVRILARKCVYIDNSLGKQVSRILQLLVQRLTALEKYEEFLQALAAADLNSSQHQHYSTSASASYNNSEVTKHATNTITSCAGNNSQSTEANLHDIFGLMDLCPSCEQLAHQLTAIELDRLSYIGPEEFVQAFAKEYQHASASQKGATNTMSGGAMNDMKKTRNLESYVEWFNRLSYLTATEIVKYPKKKQRVRIIEYWIETARECFNIGNFNSLMAIIAGLNLEPISRLKKTWLKVQSAKFSVLEHQMDPTSNFHSYRSTLKAAMWRSAGATDARERIIIPFFSLFVKDLYFLNEGCSNRLPNNNHINFEKCSQLAKQVMEFNEWKKVTCPFEKLPHVISYLQNNTILNENTLSMASFECEPPENNEEKGRYKTVKAETKQQLLQQLQQEQQQHQHH